ncbi:MAG: VTT domain-containing protein [Bacillota bacterium]|nr:VTT domain-containing protein [Bacillota bacterium]
MKKKVKADSKSKIFILPLIIFLILFTVLCIDLIPIFQKVMENGQNESVMVSYIESYGVKGIFIIMFLQIFQVFSAVLPAMPVQILAGLCYGIGYGSVISIIGYTLGHLIIFIIARKLGNALMPLSQTRKFNFVRKARNPKLLAFLLYVIPGIPNGILPYIFSKSDITPGEFLLSVALASIPGILISTVLGSRLSKGDFLTSLLLLLLCVMIIILVVIFRVKINKKIEKMD